jgi:uridine kinase
MDGNYNFDVLEALDLDLFNADMCDLLEGETIEMPTFDFKAGKKVYKGKYLKLEENDVLLIEGIHGLNPKSTSELPEENKFKIYISAMTSLNIDEHNWIPSRDIRLLRRLVRDARTRGNSAQNTLNGWRKVIDAEDEFPCAKVFDRLFDGCKLFCHGWFLLSMLGVLSGMAPQNT